MSNIIKAAHLKARRAVVLSLIGELICDSLPYGKEMDELELLEQSIKALGFDPAKPL